MKIKKGDLVMVISGKYKGKTGKVLRCFPRERKVIVEGINLIKKHRKKRKASEKSEIITQEAPIYVSKLKVVCPHCKKATKVGFELKKSGENKKVRICKKCSKSL